MDKKTYNSKIKFIINTHAITLFKNLFKKYKWKEKIFLGLLTSLIGSLFIRKKNRFVIE